MFATTSPPHRTREVGDRRVSYMFDHLGDIDFTYAVRGEGGTAPNYDDLSGQPVIASEVNVWEPFQYEIAIPPGTTLPARWEVVMSSSVQYVLNRFDASIRAFSIVARVATRKLSSSWSSIIVAAAPITTSASSKKRTCERRYA
jgi:hypothetical protein